MITEFRAWDVIGEKYIDASIIWIGCDPIGDQEISVQRGECKKTYWDPNIVLEQFTGVTDTSVEKRKIFDGDILQPTAASYKILKVVRFIPDRAAFMMANIEDLEKDWLDPWQPLSQRWVDDCRAVVIGNIHGVPQ